MLPCLRICPYLHCEKDLVASGVCVCVRALVCAYMLMFIYMHLCACMYVLWICIHWSIYYFCLFYQLCYSLLKKLQESRIIFSILSSVSREKYPLPNTLHGSQLSLFSIPVSDAILVKISVILCSILTFDVSEWMRKENLTKTSQSSSLGIVGWKNGWLFFCEFNPWVMHWAHSYRERVSFS